MAYKIAPSVSMRHFMTAEEALFHQTKKKKGIANDWTRNTGQKIRQGSCTLILLSHRLIRLSLASDFVGEGKIIITWSRLRGLFFHEMLRNIHHITSTGSLNRSAGAGPDKGILYK